MQGLDLRTLESGGRSIINEVKFDYEEQDSRSDVISLDDLKNFISDGVKYSQFRHPQSGQSSSHDDCKFMLFLDDLDFFDILESDENKSREIASYIIDEMNEPLSHCIGVVAFGRVFEPMEDDSLSLSEYCRYR